MTANSKAFILGLTGGIACGKSTVAARLAELGAIRVDADAITHELLGRKGAAVERVRETFGEGALLPNGAVDRKRLGAIVFADAAARRALEGIVHPLVQRCALEQIDAANADDVVLLEVPLLFETGMDALCGEVWAVTVSREKQVERLMERNGLSQEEALQRVDAQMSSAEKAARANVVIHTDKPIERTLAEVSNLYIGLLRRIRG